MDRITTLRFMIFKRSQLRRCRTDLLRCNNPISGGKEIGAQYKEEQKVGNDYHELDRNAGRIPLALNGQNRRL